MRKAALTTDRKLYFTLDHELTHASHFSDGSFVNWASAMGYKNAIRISEFYAYNRGAYTAQAIGSQKWANWSHLESLKYLKIK